mmetsp:Transcript_99318/g.281232  ORF Transcript_99318/g.281232 Transcript_99318/m.281232 type:complete len:304 (-) Transcript_99318:552-1463(-)
MRERICIPDERVVLPREARVLQAIHAVDCLARLNPHFDARDQDVASSKAHSGPPHDKPLARGPWLVLRGALAILEGARQLRQLPLPDAQLLQLVVGLEEHLAHGSPRQPRGLEPLLLHRVAALWVHWVQREKGLPALAEADLESHGKVLQVHCGRWLDGGRNADGARAVVERQAAHCVLRQLPTERLHEAQVLGDMLSLPANLVLSAALHLEGRLLLLAALCLLLHVLQHDLREALPVHATPFLGLARACSVTQGQPAPTAHDHGLSVRVLSGIEVRCGHAAQLPCPCPAHQREARPQGLRRG